MAPASDAVEETPATSAENSTEQPFTNAEQVRRRLAFAHLRRLSALRAGTADEGRRPD